MRNLLEVVSSSIALIRRVSSGGDATRNNLCPLEAVTEVDGSNHYISHGTTGTTSANDDLRHVPVVSPGETVSASALSMKVSLIHMVQ